ncbi:hypothetical protein TNCV_4420041 [Trichonephila clavipes]|nr:hypothetical protein TNCV_4420041 [Trichonephila clavipes]
MNENSIFCFRHLDPVLREAFTKFDDIFVAKSVFESWMDNNLLPEKQEEKVNAFSEKLRSAYRAMSRAIAGLDVAGPASQFDAAFQAYGAGEGSDKYMTELRELMKSIVKPYAPYEARNYRTATIVLEVTSRECDCEGSEKAKVRWGNAVLIGGCGGTPISFCILHILLSFIDQATPTFNH